MVRVTDKLLFVLKDYLLLRILYVKLCFVA